MPDRYICVKGAREHNLKDISVDIPRDQLVVVTGVSGSGKSSLAFDTIYAEGQRRYVESLSAYARQFLGRMEKPDVDYIEGLSPAISIDQKGVSRNPRSTVGTVTEIYDYLRLLYARAGTPHCPNCGEAVTQQTVQQIVDSVIRLDEGTRILVLAPIVTHMKGEHLSVFEDARKGGFVRVRVDGNVKDLDTEFRLNKNKWHTIETVVDRLVVDPSMDLSRLTDSIETALRLANGVVFVSIVDGEDILYSENLACAACDISIAEFEPRGFSFNTPYGACSQCAGLGFSLEVDPNLVIPDQTFSLAEGAIAPWMSGGSPRPWAHSLVCSIANEYGFSVDVPISKLSVEHLNLILYGTKKQRIKVEHTSQSGRIHSWNLAFEGVVSNLARRYQQTESPAVRDEIERYMTQRPCTLCEGLRLRSESLAVTVIGSNIIEVTQQSVEQIMKWVHAAKTGVWSDHVAVKDPLSKRELAIGEQIFKEIESRLGFLEQVGLGYLTLDRTASTLSGGEGQRIRLATQIGSGLMGVLYVCDEPSVGLHPVDGDRLIRTLRRLCDIGNTVLIVEHDEAIMRAADHIIDLGPGAGERGGVVIAEGPVEQIESASNSTTGAYLSGIRSIHVPKKRRKGNGKCLVINGARANNLKDIDVEIPLGKFVCVTGTSGSGKSSLINEVLYKRIAQLFYRAKDRSGDHTEIQGLDLIDKIINIDQAPIGRTPRSNPATYTGAFGPIRSLFASMTEAKARGYTPGRFSFNVKGGRCEACTGAGYTQIEMQFLPDVTVPCEICAGARYNREALEVMFRGKSISDVLNLTVSEAYELFENIPGVRNRLETLRSVGLGYIRLGQPATTLSGGEAQRVKLATELSKRATGKTLYILDEPTTGLSFEDCAALLDVLHKLVDSGNSVVLIEHHLDLIKSADWLIDLGPEAGDRGGEVVAEGTPEFVASVNSSYTGQYLSNISNVNSNPNAEGRIPQGKEGHEFPQTALTASKTKNLKKARKHGIPRTDLLTEVTKFPNGKNPGDPSTYSDRPRRRWRRTRRRQT